MTEQLYELPDGSWVKPSTITAIIPLRAADDLPRVVVIHNEGMRLECDCKHFGEAKEICALIAQQINGILDGEKGDP